MHIMICAIRVIQRILRLKPLVCWWPCLRTLLIVFWRSGSGHGSGRSCKDSLTSSFPHSEFPCSSQAWKKHPTKQPAPLPYSGSYSRRDCAKRIYR